jgi:hypothetical protein
MRLAPSAAVSAHARCFCAALLLSACKSEHAKERDQLAQSVSWLSTVQMLGDGWAENRVPTAYAERTLDEARAQLVAAGHNEAAALVARVKDVVRQRDRTAMARAIAALDGPRHALEQRAAMMKRSQ